MGGECCARVWVLAICVVAIAFATVPSGANSIGVNYGMVANNLPSPKQVVQLLQSQGLTKVKIYSADQTVLQAFANTGIKLIIGLPNEQLTGVATDTSVAYNWVKQNVANFYPATQIIAIAVGNEVLTTMPSLSTNLLQAMVNLHSALVNLKLDQWVKVSTPHSLSVLENSFPPSDGVFNSSIATSFILPILNFLYVTNSSPMVNVYPFFAYKSNPAQVPLNYALFLPTPQVQDSNTGLHYSNLFDAQVDAFYSAMGALNSNFKHLNITVTETGWPSAGDSNELGSNLANAEAYNANLVKHIISYAGTPLKPNLYIETYIFALFNEDQKPGPSSERNYGLFYPSMKQVYQLNLTTGALAEGNTQAKGPPGSSWCVAKSSGVSSQSLQAALDYACGPGGANCTLIQPGQVCYYPKTLWAHASYAFNSYYQLNQRKEGTCYFGGAAYVDTMNPSSATCIFPTQ